MPPSVPLAELGASVALQFASAIGPAERKLGKKRFDLLLLSVLRLTVHPAPISGNSPWRPDRSKVVATEIACKEWHSGEINAIALDADTLGPSEEDLKLSIAKALEEVQAKSSTMTLSDMKELIFRCAACLIYKKVCDSYNKYGAHRLII